MWVQSKSSLGLIIPTTDARPFCVLFSILWIINFFFLDGGNRYFSQPCLNSGHCLIFPDSSLASHRCFPHRCTNQEPAEFLRGTLCRSPTFFLCAAPLFLAFCPKNPSCLSLQRVFVLSPYLGSPLNSTSVSPPCTLACKLSQGRKQGQQYSSRGLFSAFQGSLSFIA